MILIEKTEIMGWEAAIRGMRNPMNSWAKSDTEFSCGEIPEVGESDLDLMSRLAKAGTEHRKYLRMLAVYVDLTAPLYWWKEFDTYKVGTVANSCSTMHKIHAKEFTLEDFSCEHLKEPYLSGLQATVAQLNAAREAFLASKDKEDWWQMIQLLPTSYNQKRTVMLNYEVLANIYRSRKNHKLDEWRKVCAWIENLPCAALITG
ncbi:MAG: hypothetical protein IJA48_05100 [Oscillospiraceae bacterium]|nr:hypothetical protein [Oscillospiraceae bacterium]